FQKLLDVFNHLGRSRFLTRYSQRIPELDGLVSEIASVEQERNGVVHSFWLGLASGKAIGIKFPRGGRGKWFQPQFREMSVVELNEIAEKIQRVGVKLGTLSRELYEEVEP